MTGKILYATKIGAPDWAEDVITDHEDRIEAAETWALANGFDRLRIANFDLSKAPDFGSTISNRSNK